MKDNKARSSAFSILIIVGGLIGIIAVFLAWLSMEWGGITIFSMSGWEVMREGFDQPNLSNLSDNYVQWMPLIVLLFSVIALFIGLAALVKPKKEMGIGAVMCGIIMIIAAIVFYTYKSFGVAVSDFAGMGIYLAMAAGVVLLIFGALRLSVSNDQ